MIKFILSPFDVLFFGGGKPFNINFPEAISIFPPFPNTLASSVCSKIYNEKKINVDKIIKNLYGPFLEKGGELLFSKPFDILKEKKKIKGEISQVELKREFKLIKPSYTDLEINWLLWEKEKGKEFEIFEGWIKYNGLEKWLNNQKVESKDIVDKNEIFEYEKRVGIKMDYSKNVTKGEDSLYRIDFIRLKEDVKIIFFVDFKYDNDELKRANLDSEEKMLDFFNDNKLKVLKLGGETRGVKYECQLEDFTELLKIPEIKENDIIKILYLTPGLQDSLKNDEIYEILFIAMGRFINLGMHTKNYGVKIKRAIPSGSVVYAKVKDSEKIKEIFLTPRNGEFIGSDLRIYGKI